MHKYYYRNRPPGIGCQPDGFDVDTRETWIPRKQVDGIYYLGKVNYPEPLSYEQMWQYDLRSTNPVVFAKFVFWLEARQDGGRDWLCEEYLGMDRAVLEEGAPRDIFAQCALIILDAPGEGKNEY